MQLVRLLKDVGVGGGHGGNTEARWQQKVWFVNEVVGRGTGAPAPVLTTREYRGKTVRLPVSVWMYVSMYFVQYFDVTTR